MARCVTCNDTGWEYSDREDGWITCMCEINKQKAERTNPMNHCVTELNALVEKLTQKGFTRAEADIFLHDTEQWGAEGVIRFEFTRSNIEREAHRFTFKVHGEAGDYSGYSTAYIAAVNAIDELPTDDEAEVIAFRKKLASVLEDAKRVGLHDDTVAFTINPLTDMMKQLSENVIEHAAE